MPDPDPATVQSAELLRQLCARDEDAAVAVFEQYAERLTRLARSRISARLAARIDAEDIVQSAYRSFFVAAREGRFEVAHGGDLWRLLVELVLHKLYGQVVRHSALRRSIVREQAWNDSVLEFKAIADREPTPDEAAATGEELEAILGQLAPRERLAVEMRLQGYEQQEIADRLKCSERTVRRMLSAARRVIVARGGGSFIPSAACRRAPARTPTFHRPRLINVRAPLPWSDFLLREQIGAGATGKVYRALQRSTGRAVAIKFLRKSLVRDSAMVEIYLREAEIVSRLDHPGIVAIHGAGTTPGGGVFLALDLVDGIDLGRIGEQRLASVPEALTWVAQAASAIQLANESGVIYCDLNPQILLLDRY